MNLFNKVFSNDTICRRKPQKPTIDDNISNKSTEFTKSFSFMEDLQELYDYCGKISYGPKNSPLMIIEDTFESPDYSLNLDFLQEEFSKVNINFHNIYRASLFAPKISDVQIYGNLLNNHIQLINPKILWVMGSECLKNLISFSKNSKDSQESLLKIHGKLMNYNNITMFPTFHPSYIRKSEKNKTLFRKDLNILKEFLINNSISI